MDSSTETTTQGSGPVLVRIEEAAVLLAVSRAHVYRLIREGCIPTVRLGRAMRVPLAAIQDLAIPGQRARKPRFPVDASHPVLIERRA